MKRTSSIRPSIDAVAAGICERAHPCAYCRGLVRDVIADWLNELPQLELMSPLEMRLRVLRDGGDA